MSTVRQQLGGNLLNVHFFIYPITIIYVNVMLRVYVFFLVSGGT